MCLVKAPKARKISIHAPREGGDMLNAGQARKVKNFNPRPPRGGRPRADLNKLESQLFQSTPPARGATKLTVEPFWSQGFQSTPPARGATSTIPSRGRTSV